jgi:hypothetical protein
VSSKRTLALVVASNFISKIFVKLFLLFVILPRREQKKNSGAPPFGKLNGQPQEFNVLNSWYLEAIHKLSKSTHKHGKATILM